MFQTQGIPINIPRIAEKDFIIPENIVLMLNPEFRRLRQHYYNNIETIKQNHLNIERLDIKLSENAKSLSLHHVEINKLQPLFEKAEFESREKHAELHIIAKKRAIINNHKKKNSRLNKMKWNDDNVMHKTAPETVETAKLMKKFFEKSFIIVYKLVTLETTRKKNPIRNRGKSSFKEKECAAIFRPTYIQ